MKSKTFNKKLFLNKTTIANLKNKQMKDVPGGKPMPDTDTWGGEYSCPNTLCYTHIIDYPLYCV